MSEKQNDIEYRCKVLGNCGKTHSFEEWQKCPSCDPRREALDALVAEAQRLKLP